MSSQSEQIRARMADLEARARQRAEFERAGRQEQEPLPGKEGASGTAEAWPWQFLFESAPRDEDHRPAGPTLDSWLAEGLRGLRSQLHGLGLDEEFWNHLRAAERELLLAARCLLEARLRRLEAHLRDEAPSATQRQTIDVEFE